MAEPKDQPIFLKGLQEAKPRQKRGSDLPAWLRQQAGVEMVDKKTGDPLAPSLLREKFLLAQCQISITGKKAKKENFPLLSQILAERQAVCAGKSYILTMILKDLGLDARVARVLIRLNSTYESSHSECQVNLPGGIILALDGNFRNYSRPFGFAWKEIKQELEER